LETARGVLIVPPERRRDDMSSTSRQALVAGAILVASIVGCSNDRTRVRRETEIVRDRPTAVQPAPSETVIRKDSSYEHTVEDR
jgi:hypothetical protein